MMRTIQVGNRRIGEGCPVFVIAEAGCNHENDFARACEMVTAAAEAGADAIKFQSFTPETLVTRDAKKFWDIPGPGATQYEECVDAQPRFTREQYQELIALAARHGILFFSTPSDETWADFLDGLEVQLFKIASMDLTHLPLLRHVARKRKPLILSTGASSIAEVREAVKVIQAEGHDALVLLHCISLYPTQPAQVHLGMIRHLAQEFPACVIGYSDHTLPTTLLLVPVLAVAVGAVVIEKHFTFDRSRPGYDHAISADYAGFKRMVQDIRQVEQMLGDQVKAPLPEEERTRQFGRRSLVAAQDIPQGATIRPSMLAVKRPGTGIEPKLLEQVVGKVAVRHVRQDQVMTWDLVQEA